MSRKKFERELMQGYVCENCRRFYNALGFTEKQKQNLIQLCSRHRLPKGVKPPKDPDNFWNMNFPNEKKN